jgi:hypothetical protein
MCVRKYRKKPIVVEAVQYRESTEGHNILFEFMKPEFIETKVINGDTKLVLQTLEGEIYATSGDYIIKGINGEFYPCKKDIFLKTYEEV